MLLTAKSKCVSSLANYPRFIQWVAIPLLILGCASLTNAIILLLCGYNPVQAYTAAARVSLGSVSGLSETLVKTTPFLMTGLSVGIAFRCGIWNIGAEGQLLVGALGATWFGTRLAYMIPHTSWIGVPLCLTTAILTGGLWGVIPAILKVTRNVNEVISTIMLNYVAIHLMGLMIEGGPLQETSKIGSQSDSVVEWVRLTRFVAQYRLHYGIVIALVLAVVLTFVLFRTTFGYQLRAVGEGAAAAKAAGISVARNTLQVFFISGALAGLGGAIELMALANELTKSFSPGYGYTAIAVALMAKLHPLGTVATALLFGALSRGSFAMEGEIGISGKVTWMMQAIILLYVIGFSSARLFNKQSTKQP